MRTGTGSCGAHHGELLQGWFTDAADVARPGLVTLPLPGCAVRATFTPGGRGITVSPPDRSKADRAARLAAEAVGAPGGDLVLDGGVPAGLGMGSSTADVVATVRAVADTCGVVPSPRTIARIAVGAEAASDPLMFDDRPRLFAHRDGDVLEDLGAALPPLRVLGCLLESGRPVDTPLARPPRPSPSEVAFYADLRGRLRRAVVTGDSDLLGRVATASALRARPGPDVERLRSVAAATGAVGVQIAHSGNVAGLLFDAAGPLSGPHRAAAALRAHGLPPTRLFAIGGRPWTHTSPTPSDDRTWSVSTTG
ncbi:GHMP kinase [Pseudonocardia endophytica]|uniref:Threonine kinase n=1 Tax=Pseudonocardia endophytica TaxID=401976 RepID=A0A4R1HVX3_PSEEN|nr:GHMP kinase [Pseudonocardia endophytica]TCK25591.1 threonine kinase [Pseudonocardia endophytica]